MENIEKQNVDLSKFSRPIELNNQKKTGFFTKISEFFASKPAINIISTSPKPKATDKNNIKLDNDQNKNHSQTSDSSLASEFFDEQNIETAAKPSNADTPQKDQNIWFGPDKNIEHNKIEENNPVSLLWLIGGAILIVIIIVMILGSFGLINLIKTSIDNNSLDNTSQAIKQSATYLSEGKFDQAEETIMPIITSEPQNEEAQVLLQKIHQSLGEKIIYELDKFTSLENANPNFTVVNDELGHFSVAVSPDWKKIESNYDLKYATNQDQTNVGIKKFPRVDSISQLEKQFLAEFVGKDYEIINTKSEKTYFGSEAKVYVIKINNLYQYSILFQKYNFGYEISAWLPLNYNQTQIVDIQNFLKSFSLTGSYSIENYNQLVGFGNEKINFSAWPDALNTDQQNEIISSFMGSINYINENLKTSYNGNMQIYLYPDFATLYQYTLSKNSFSNYQTNTIHLVYKNTQDHQSFGYEPAKIIYQSSFGEVTESLVLEGIAVWLDQTGRDYRSIVKNSTYIPLESLLSVGWDLNQTDLKYHEAGIFTQYLIDQYGIDLYRDLSQEKEFPDAYQKIYNKSLTLLESEFLSAL